MLFDTAFFFSVQEKMEELLERLVFDVDAAVTEFTRKGTIGNRTVGRAGDKRDIFIRALQNIKCSIPDNVYERVRLVLYACNEGPEQILGSYGIPQTVDDLTDYLRGAVLGDKAEVSEGQEGALKEWSKAITENEVGSATVFAFIRRLKLAKKEGLSKLWRAFPHTLQGEVTEAPSFNYSVGRAWDRKGGITVIDLSKLHSSMQAFVVGAVLRQVLEAKMAHPKATEEPVFIFLDELNKYAPRTEGGAMVKLFRDVAERGRSFGVILVGAEQTASQVDFRVVTQSSTTVVGHQKAAELSHDEYKHLLPRQREMASSVGPGVVFVDQPFLRVPIMVKFPMTRWSTKETKVTTQGFGLTDIFG